MVFVIFFIFLGLIKIVVFFVIFGRDEILEVIIGVL